MSTFDSNVFINCPFDQEYTTLLRPLCFTVILLNLTPQISTNSSSSHIRIQKIMDLMKISKYSIHDISRNISVAAGEMPRFNMPYEMGLDIGCSVWGNKEQQTKECLVLDAHPHNYDQFFSDISGQDIKAHDKNPQKLISCIKDWFEPKMPSDILPGPTAIWDNYTEFLVDMNEKLTAAKWTTDEINNLAISKFNQLATEWWAKKTNPV